MKITVEVSEEKLYGFLKLAESFISTKDSRPQGHPVPDMGLIADPLPEVVELGNFLRQREKVIFEGIDAIPSEIVPAAIKGIENLIKEREELYSIIAPLRDLGFEWLNKQGGWFLKNQHGHYKRIGEVIDRANEYFNGR